MIDLLNLAKEIEELHKEVDCSFGTIKIYHVPDVVFLSSKLSVPEPMQPMVRMKTKTGHQDRLSKPGDKEYDQWQSDFSDYNEEMTRLRSAIRLVNALKDTPYPDTSVPPTAMANNIYNGNWPSDPIMQKKIWLDFTIMAKRNDSDLIYSAINEMAGMLDVTDDMIDEVKKSSE